MGPRPDPVSSCRTSISVRRFWEAIRDPFSWSDGLERGQGQDDGYERRDLKERPYRLPSREPTVDVYEDRLFGNFGAEPKQVRGRAGRREDVGR